MDRNDFPLTHCLTHQLPEDRASAVGRVCPACRKRLQARPPSGRCLRFWESQPAAYSLQGDPCFVYTVMWDDFRIRSLCLPGTKDVRELRRRRAVKRCDGGHATARRRPYFEA